MTVLITGGAGFIGSRLARQLRERDQLVILLDNFNNYYDPVLKRANVAPFKGDSGTVVVEGDIRDSALIDRLMMQYQVTHVVNMAAMAGVRNSVDQPALYYDVNVMGTLNLLEAARKYHIEQFVQASTSSVYGKTQCIPFVESDSADRPLAPYPASKRAAEILAHAYHHQFGLNITCLRFFNVYGPQGRPDMMPLKVIDALCHDQPITLFDSGNLSRDWTYIDDIVSGVVSALETPLAYEILNLGCGAPISMTEFVDFLEKLSGKAARRVNVPAPPSEPPITYCNNTLAQQKLGFRPTISVREGLTRTWEWYLSR